MVISSEPPFIIRDAFGLFLSQRLGLIYILDPFGSGSCRQWAIQWRVVFLIESAVLLNGDSLSLIQVATRFLEFGIAYFGKHFETVFAARRACMLRQRLLRTSRSPGQHRLPPCSNSLEVAMPMS